jgi:hypothetical protein
MAPSAYTLPSQLESITNGAGGSGTTSGNGGGIFYMYGIADDTTTVSGGDFTAPSASGSHAMMSVALTPVTSTDIQVASERLGVVVTRADDEVQVSALRLGVVLTTDASVAVQVASLRLGVVVDTTPLGTTKGSICILW